MDTAVLTRALLRSTWAGRTLTRAALASAVLALLTNAACAVKKIAINKLGDALASGGTT